MISFAECGDDLALDKDVTLGALCAEVGLVAVGAVVVLVLGEEAPLGKADIAAFTVEAPVMKIKVVDAENFSGTLFMATFAICFAEEAKRRFERAEAKAFFLLFSGGL